MKKAVIAISLILMTAVFLHADDNTLDYLEGFLEVKGSAAWEEISIGEEISPEAFLRLSDNGYAEILIGDVLVTLIQDGEYYMKELTRGISSVSSGSLDLKKKLTLNSDYQKWRQEATMGVRGAEQSSMDFNTGMEDAITYLNAGLELLAEEDYKNALVNFEEGWEFFEDDNCLFFSAVCYEELGQKRSYVRTLQSVTPDYLDEEYKAAHAIRMGDLLISSLAFEDAVAMLEGFTGSDLDRDGEEEQKIHYLLGRGYWGLNRTRLAKNQFSAARDMNPSSEVGRMASDALRNF